MAILTFQVRTEIAVVIHSVSGHFASQVFVIVGVNARVSNVIEWITTNVCEMSDSPPEFCFTSPNLWWTLVFVTSIIVLITSGFCLGKRRHHRKAYVELSTTEHTGTA